MYFLLPLGLFIPTCYLLAAIGNKKAPASDTLVSESDAIKDEQPKKLSQPNHPLNATGKTFLKVSGILLVILGAIFSLIFAALLLKSDSYLTFSQYTALSCCLILNAFSVVIGIIGICNCKKPEKSNVCLILVIIIMAAQVLSPVISAIANSDDVSLFIATFILGLLPSLILSILYLIGASKNKRAFIAAKNAVAPPLE